MNELPNEGDVFDGKYCIGAVLGIGGMAAVLAAKHLGFDERVALKILLPDCCDDPEIVRRFMQEGRTAIKIRSEHVVRMLDVGVVSGRAYLVMEYLDGKDLEVLLRQGGPLPPATAVDFLLQACEAIGEAHALGIVHRDLKPANLFLTHRADGSPCVKVLDFGISKVPPAAPGVRGTGASPTLPSMVMGSPQYMSPEQMASAASADQRSDIWSLGTILYELLAGEIAFGGVTTAEVCARVLQGSAVPIAQIQGDVPGELAAIVGRCLEKDPARRYANVAELARALAPFGTSGARASAASIARVLERALDDPSRSVSEAGTMKPTAAEILAGPAPVRRRGKAGYVAGSLLALAVSAAVVVAVLRPAMPLHVRWPLATLAAAAPLPQPSSPPAPVLATAPAGTAPSALAPPPPAPRPGHASGHHHAAPSSALSAPPAADAGADDDDPYDAP